MVPILAQLYLLRSFQNEQLNNNEKYLTKNGKINGKKMIKILQSLIEQKNK